MDLCRESFLGIKKVGTFPHKRLEDSPWPRAKDTLREWPLVCSSPLKPPTGPLEEQKERKEIAEGTRGAKGNY